MPWCKSEEIYPYNAGSLISRKEFHFWNRLGLLHASRNYV